MAIEMPMQHAYGPASHRTYQIGGNGDQNHPAQQPAIEAAQSEVSSMRRSKTLHGGFVVVWIIENILA